MKNQSGQALLILLLATLVALTIGLAITQRSLTDVSNSTKVEQTSRAFSAAEAGLQKGYDPSNTSSISNNTYITSSELGNNTQASLNSSGLVPGNSDTNGIAYPPIDKTTFAHFWLADILTLGPIYTQPNINVFFGNPKFDTDQNNWPAIEVRIIYRSNDGAPCNPPASYCYKSVASYYDPNPTRRLQNNTSAPTCATNSSTGPWQSAVVYSVNTADPKDAAAQNFFCQASISSSLAGYYPVLARVRLLYTPTSEVVAMVPAGSNSLPGQVIIYNSSGTSGSTLRKLSLFTVKNVVPYYFDFAIFSNGDISKQ